MNTTDGDILEIDIVGLILVGDEEEADPVHELHPLQGRDAHEQEHAKQDGHRDQLEDRSHEDTETGAETDED